MGTFLKKNSTDRHLQKYHKIISTIRLEFGVKTSRQSKSDWLKKMKDDVENYHWNRNTIFYQELMKSTDLLYKWKPMEYIKGEGRGRIHKQIIQLYNRGVINHHWGSDFDEMIGLFHRTWMSIDDPKYEKRYIERGRQYFMSENMNMWVVQFMIFLWIQGFPSDPE